MMGKIIRSSEFSEREMIASGEQLLIVRDDDGNEVARQKDEFEVKMRIPCTQCSRDCYNFQMGDCKNIGWVRIG